MLNYRSQQDLLIIVLEYFITVIFAWGKGRFDRFYFYAATCLGFAVKISISNNDYFEFYDPQPKPDLLTWKLDLLL